VTVRHYIKIFDKLILCSINTSISVCSCHTEKNDLTLEKKKKGKQKATGIKRVYTHNNILVFDGNQKGNYSEKINRKNRPGGFCGFVRRCNMKEGLLKEIAAHGDRGAIVPISRFDELKSEIEALKTDKHNMFINWMAKYMTIPDGLDFQPRSLISVITPSPKIMFGFTYHGKLIHFMVPPQYLDMDLRDNEVLQYINAYLEPYGHRAAIFEKLPQKLLAVHSGLGQYGRNNLCYHEEYGSYIRILSYISDLPCDVADWFPIRRMDACENCHACVTACPTNAIESDHRIINTSICLTMMNEVPGEFPEWVPENAHNSLIGCMKCQDCCPANAHNKDNIVKGVTFSEEETKELLMHKDDEPYSDSLAAKIKVSGFFTDFLKVLPRNLAVLLQM
jgi:epoxyqueuosine reductase